MSRRCARVERSLELLASFGGAFGACDPGLTQVLKKHTKKANCTIPREKGVHSEPAGFRHQGRARLSAEAPHSSGVARALGRLAGPRNLIGPSRRRSKPDAEMVALARGQENTVERGQADRLIRRSLVHGPPAALPFPRGFVYCAAQSKGGRNGARAVAFPSPSRPRTARPARAAWPTPPAKLSHEASQYRHHRPRRPRQDDARRPAAAAVGRVPRQPARRRAGHGL